MAPKKEEEKVEVKKEEPVASEEERMAKLKEKIAAEKKRHEEIKEAMEQVDKEKVVLTGQVKELMGKKALAPTAEEIAEAKAAHASSGSADAPAAEAAAAATPTPDAEKVKKETEAETQQMQVRQALRDATTVSDLEKAIARAEGLDMKHETQLGKKRLEKMKEAK